MSVKPTVPRHKQSQGFKGHSDDPIWETLSPSLGECDHDHEDCRSDTCKKCSHRLSKRRPSREKKWLGATPARILRRQEVIPHDANRYIQRTTEAVKEKSQSVNKLRRNFQPLHHAGKPSSLLSTMNHQLFQTPESAART